MLDFPPTLPRPLKVLVACETSGTVRRAFQALGHDVTSCDVLASDDGSNHHVICDVRDGILQEGWDLMAVMHPPCTRLCRSGRQWMSGAGKWTTPKRLPKGRTLDDMKAEFEEGIDVFLACWNAPIDRVVIENPVMNDLAQDRMPDTLAKPQIIQPWHHGEKAFKGTGLYMRGLPHLVDTNRLTPPERGTSEHKAWSMIHNAAPGPDRWKLRSKTFDGIATAIATQMAQHSLAAIAA